MDHQNQLLIAGSAVDRAGGLPVVGDPNGYNKGIKTVMLHKRKWSTRFDNFPSIRSRGEGKVKRNEFLIFALRDNFEMGLVISSYTITISSYSVFTTLWATHGDKGVNLWIDGKMRILIVTFLDHI